MYNKCVFMGRITNDLELRTTPTGVNVCTFRIAVDRRYADKDGKRQTDFFTVVAWRQQADYVCRWFGKGRMILVEGEMTTRRYTDKNNIDREVFELVAERLSFTGEKAKQVSDSGYYPDEPPSTPAPPSEPSAPKEYTKEDYEQTDDDYPF